MSKQGVQTFLIECNRGNSQIDATAPTSNNAKWTTKTDFQFKRGDRVGVEAIMIESIGAGSSQQTIEFSGDNVRQGNTIKDWTDDVVVLEFGFYINNNGNTTINLPIKFPNIIGNNNGAYLKINSGEYGVQPIQPGLTRGINPLQYPGVSNPSGQGTKDNAGYNPAQVAPATATAYALQQLYDANDNILPLPVLGGIEIKAVSISNAADAPPATLLTCEFFSPTIPLAQAYNMEGINLPFAQGMNLIMLDGNGIYENYGVIKEVVPELNSITGLPTGRAKIILANPHTLKVGGDLALHRDVFCSCNNGGDQSDKRYGYSANPFQSSGYAGEERLTYSPGGRIGMGLYNHSAWSIAGNAASMPINTMRKRGGAMLWEQTRVWSAVDATEVPSLGPSTATTPLVNVGGRNMETLDLRRYKDNAPYIMVAPEYMGPQPTPNGQGMCPKLQPMTAYVVIRAENAFEDVNNLADKFTQAFHAINPLITNEGSSLQKYIDNQQFPFNKTNNTIPLISQGHFSRSEGLVHSVGWNNSTSALWNRVSPLWIGNLVKCLPANIQSGINYKYQPGGQYFYEPNDANDYLKVGYKGDWNWNNLIYGNMGLKDFRKCWGGDRFIRLKCWDCNEAFNADFQIRHRDVPKPIILNNQLVPFAVQSPGSNFTNPFNFVGSYVPTNQMIFTNIEYTEANLDIIEEVFRECEDYQVSNPQAVNGIDAQQSQPFWEWEADIGMTDAGRAPKNINLGTGYMRALQTNWAIAPPAAAVAGGNPTAAQGGLSVLCPSQSYQGNGGEIDVKNAREVGRMKIWSRWNTDWDDANSANRPTNAYELNIPNLAKCEVYNNQNFIHNPQLSRDRNIGVIPYKYTDEDGTEHTFCGFASSRNYEPSSNTNPLTYVNACSTWELGFINWGDSFGFSPQYGYDQPAVIPMNTDDINDTFDIETPAGVKLYPNLKWRWNNQNFVWVGANDAAMTFDDANNRFQFKQLYTQSNLSIMNATLNAQGSVVQATPQVGEEIATLNTETKDNMGYLQTDTLNPPPNYNKKNQGVQDSVAGVFLNNVYFAPKGWKPPQNINPQNVYDPYAGYNNETNDYTTYLNKAVENRKEFLKPLTKATRENWTGNMLDKMGFDYYQIKPPYGSQDNRYSQFTYGSDDIEIMYQGKKPLMLNAEIDVAADLDINIFKNNTNIAIPYPTAPAATTDGTPLYLNKLLNNQPVNLGDNNSAVLTANRIPTLFACPFYIVISDICPTEFQSGSFKQDCIFYGLKNYGAGQYFYVFGSNYTQLVDTDRTITSVNTEIRNPLTGRLARLSKNSCIIYKVERDIVLPPPMVDVDGNPIQIAPTPQQEEMSELLQIKNAIIGSHGASARAREVNGNVDIDPRNNRGQGAVIMRERALPQMRADAERGREVLEAPQQVAQEAKGDDEDAEKGRRIQEDFNEAKEAYEFLTGGTKMPKEVERYELQEIVRRYYPNREPGRLPARTQELLNRYLEAEADPVRRGARESKRTYQLSQDRAARAESKYREGKEQTSLREQAAQTIQRRIRQRAKDRGDAK